MDELLSIPIHKELNVIQINISEKDQPSHKLVNVPLDTSILELQEQIFCKTNIPVNHQYLFFLSSIDNYFYKLIDNLFSGRTFLAKEKILEFLDKILHNISNIKFTKSKFHVKFY